MVGHVQIAIVIHSPSPMPPATEETAAIYTGSPLAPLIESSTDIVWYGISDPLKLTGTVCSAK